MKIGTTEGAGDAWLLGMNFPGACFAVVVFTIVSYGSVRRYFKSFSS